jgi:hypothetical protein
MAMVCLTENHAPVQLSVGEAQAIVAEAAHRYFDSRRALIDRFVDQHFSLSGSLALHRKALGWDLLKAPANMALALPYIGAQLTARIAARFGAARLARYLAARPILLKTAVARELEWLLMTDFLELPFRQGSRGSRKDALAEAVLAAPYVQSAVAGLLETVGARASDLEFRDRLERMIATYTETRAAAAEITTTMTHNGGGRGDAQANDAGRHGAGPGAGGRHRV